MAFNAFHTLVNQAGEEDFRIQFDREFFELRRNGLTDPDIKVFLDFVFHNDAYSEKHSETIDSFETLVLAKLNQASSERELRQAELAMMLFHRIITKCGITLKELVDFMLNETDEGLRYQESDNIRDLNLTVKVNRSLELAGLDSIRRLVSMIQRSGYEEFYIARNFGEKSYRELVRKLVEAGHLDASYLEN